MNIINPGFQVQWLAVVEVSNFHIFIGKSDGVGIFQKGSSRGHFVGVALQFIFGGDFHQCLYCSCSCLNSEAQLIEERFELRTLVKRLGYDNTSFL